MSSNLPNNPTLPTNSSTPKEVKIGEAAKILGVSIDSLRRWEKSGKLTAFKTPGGTRYYHLDQLLSLNKKELKYQPVIKPLEESKNIPQTNSQPVFQPTANPLPKQLDGENLTQMVQNLNQIVNNLNQVVSKNNISFASQTTHQENNSYDSLNFIPANPKPSKSQYTSQDSPSLPFHSIQQFPAETLINQEIIKESQPLFSQPILEITEDKKAAHNLSKSSFFKPKIYATTAILSLILLFAIGSTILSYKINPVFTNKLLSQKIALQLPTFYQNSLKNLTKNLPQINPFYNSPKTSSLALNPIAANNVLAASFSQSYLQINSDTDIQGSLAVNGDQALTGNLVVGGTGKFTGDVTAPNLLNGLKAGNNISVTGTGTPTISSTDTLSSVTSRGGTTSANLTLNGTITLGNILALGSLSSDPTTATNGMSYYNTTTNSFRCYQNGSWTDCISTAGGSFNSFTLAASSGISQSVTNGATVTIAADNGVSTTASSTDTVTVGLNLSTSGTTSTTSSNSGLEVSSSGLSLIRGCTDQQVLQWNSGSGVWACATQSGSLSGSGSPGQLSFWNGTSSLTGSANLFFDSGTNRLGILTNSPANTFSVGASSQFQVSSTGAIAAATGITSSGTINFSGLTASSAVYTDVSHNLTTTAPTSGAIGYWTRSGTTLSPTTSGDAVTTSGNISTTGSGTITSASTLTASNGFTMSTGALSLTSTSGAISATGLTALTLTNTSGTAAITAPTLNLNTSATGNTAIGNSSGTFALVSSGGLNVTTGGGLTGVASLDTITTSSTALTFAGAGAISAGGSSNLTLDAGTSGKVQIGGTSTGDIELGGGSGSTGCTVTNSNGNFACTGNITGATTGTVGYWTRSGTTLSPTTSGDAVTTSGNISTTGSGTITSAGLLTGSLGITVTGGTVNLNASSNNNTNINTGSSNGSVAIGNSAAGAIALSTGSTFGVTTTTNPQTYTSGVTNGTTTSSGFVFNASSLTSGTALYLTSSATSGKLLDLNASQTSGTISNLAYGSPTSLTGDLTGQAINLSSDNLTATNQNITGSSITIPTVTNTNSSGTKTLTGLSIVTGSGAGINQNGAGTTTFAGANISIPSLTQSSGTLNGYGLEVTTPSSITTGGTANGLFVNATGVGAGTLSGLNIGGITGGAGTEYALNIGSGWDAVLRVGSTTVINGSGVVQPTAGGTGLTSYTTGDLIYASGTNTLSTLAGGAGNNGKVLTISAGVPIWSTIAGSSCTDCVINDPSSVTSNTISPTGDTTGLIVKQTTTSSPTSDIFDITDKTGLTKYFYVDANGNVSTGAISNTTLTLTPTSNVTALTLVGTNVTSAPLQYINAKNSSTTSGLVNIAYGASQTLTGSLTAIKEDLSTNLTATNQSVTGDNITLPGATNTSGTQNYKGLVITGGAINENGGTATNYIGADITIPALTQTSGTLNGYGVQVTTPSSITTGGTAAGININAAGVGAGTLYGVNIGGITGGAGSEYALNIGSGWDRDINFSNSAATIVIPNSGTVTFKNASGSSLCSITDNSGVGSFSCGSSGSTGYWTRSGTTLSPATSGDAVTTSGNISTTGSGTITSAGLLTGSAGLTVSGGTANINVSGSSNTAIGNSSGTFALVSSGGLNVTTGGALTGVASLDTITTSATALTFAGAGSVAAGGSSNLALDAGTTGAVNIAGVSTGGVEVVGAGGKGLGIATAPTATSSLILTGIAGGGITNGSNNLGMVQLGGTYRPGADSTTINGLNEVTTVDAHANSSITGNALNIGSSFSLSSGSFTTQTALNLAPTFASSGNINQIATNGITANSSGTAYQVNLGTVTGASSATFGDITTGAISGSGTTSYGINLGANSSTATTNYGINIGNISGATSGTNVGIQVGAVSGASDNFGIFMGAISGGNDENTDIQLGSITAAAGSEINSYFDGSGANITGTASSAGENAGFIFGNISATGQSDYGMDLGTLTGGNTNNAQIKTGDVTAVASATNSQLHLGKVTGTAASSTNYGISLTGLDSTGTTNYGLYVGSVSGASTNYAAYFAGGNVNIQGLTASSAIYTDASHNLTTTAPTSGAIGYWTRSGTTLSPTTSGDAVTTSGNISTTGSGTITSAGLLTGSAGLTVSGGTANINVSGSSNTAIGNSSGTFALVSSGGLNVTTGGALTGVASLDTITTSATALTFAGAGTISSTGSNALTLDSGTTGNVNIGNSSNAKTITIGNNTGATALNLTSGTGSQTFTSSVVSTSTTSSAFVFTDNTTLTGTEAYIGSTGVTSGTLLNIDTGAANTLANGKLLSLTSASTGLTTGSLLSSSFTGAGSTGFTGNLNFFDYSPSSASTTAPTGDILRINLGANGSNLTGNLFNVVNNSSSIFSVSQAAVTSSIPVSFNATGDVSMAYDINFTNPTSSFIKSLAPITIQPGTPFNSSNLTVNLYNQGSFVVQNSVTSGSAVTDYLSYLSGTDTTSNASTQYTDYSTLTLTGNAAKVGEGYYSTISSSSTTGDTLVGFDSAISATGALGATTRTAYGVRSQPASTAATANSSAILNMYGAYLAPSSTLATAGTDNVYGIYINNTATHAANAGTVNNYGVYIDSGTSSTNGTSTKYGLYVASQASAGTNYAIYTNGGLIKNNSTSSVILSNAALATNATDGFTYIPTSAGTPSGTPTTQTGTTAMEYDTTNNKLEIYNGAWKTTTGFADYSEWAPAAGAESGDLVTITDLPNPVNDPVSPFMLGQTTTPYDNKVVGVISQYAEDANMAYGYKESPDYHAVALVGRVPVKVSTENGPISKGDYLTSSSTPGVAMKATKAGQMIGKALEDYSSPNVSTIMAFIQVSYDDPNNFLASLSFDDQGNLVMPNISTNKIVVDSELDVNGTLNVNGNNISTNTTNNNTTTQSTSSDQIQYTDLTNQVASLSGEIAQLQTTVATLQANSNPVTLPDNLQASGSGQINESSSSASNSSDIAEATNSASPSADLSLNEASSSATASGTLTLTPADTLFASSSAILTNLNVTQAVSTLDLTTSETLKSLGQTFLGQTTIAGDLSVDGTFSVDNGNSINALPTLYIQNSTLASSVDIFNGALTISKDGTLVANTISANEYRAATGQSVGSGILPAGKLSVDITTPIINANSHILITPNINTTQILAVTNKVAGQKFTVSILTPSSSDIKFDWYLVNEK